MHALIAGNLRCHICDERIYRSRRVAEKIGAKLTEVNVPVPGKNRVYVGVRYTIPAGTNLT